MQRLNGKQNGKGPLQPNSGPLPRSETNEEIAMKHTDIIQKLNLEQKCALLSGETVFTTRDFSE